MKYKNKMLLIVLLLISYSQLSAEVIVLKTNGSNLVALDPVRDKENYVGTTGSGRSIFAIITHYQWPTNLLFADELNERERNELFSPQENAEITFIDRKLREAYPAQSYRSVYIPNTVYQLYAIAYYAEQLQTTDPTADKLKELANTLADYFETFFFEPDQRLVSLPSSLQEFLDACKKPCTDPLVAEINFLIGCELGKKIENIGIPTLDAWKSIATECISKILRQQKAFDALPVPEGFTPEDRFNFARFAEELSGTKLKSRGIVEHLIEEEIKANTTNQALLMQASSPFAQPIAAFSGSNPNRNVLTSSLVFSTVAELIQDNTNNQFKPHATSYGLYPFTGAFYCKYDMPYDYATEKTSYFNQENYFFALKINKHDYYTTRCNNLFIIPPFSPLTELFGRDSMYHALTTVAFRTIPTEPIEIHGFETVYDPAGIVFIQEDPIDHAQRLVNFAAQNSLLLKVPHNKTWADGLQLLKNFAVAREFYTMFSTMNSAAQHIEHTGEELVAQYQSLPAGEQKTDIYHRAQQALLYNLAQVEEYPTVEAIQSIRQAKSILGQELPNNIHAYVQSMANRWIKRLLFARTVRLVPNKFFDLSLGSMILDGLIPEQQWSMLKRIEDEARQAQETLQTMPAASIWPDSAAGVDLSALYKKTSFIKDCANLAKENEKIKPHPHDNTTIRVATYNVHSWQDPYGKYDVFSSPFSTISALDADVLILQEVSIPKNQYAEYKNEYLQQYPYGWESFGDTNNPPSDMLFGNLILSKYPFESAPVVTSFSAQYNSTHEDTSAKRCFIQAKIKLPNTQTLSLYGTHLDVFDSTEVIRLKQIAELTKFATADKSDYVLIAGDLNSVRQEDYIPQSFWDLVVAKNAKRQVPTPTLVLQHLKQAGFVDCFTQINKPGPTFTTWNGTTIDFIMLKSGWNLPISNCAVYFDAASDHLPVLMDINVAQLPQSKFLPRKVHASKETSEQKSLSPEQKMLFKQLVKGTKPETHTEKPLEKPENDLAELLMRTQKHLQDLLGILSGSRSDY